MESYTEETFVQEKDTEIYDLEQIREKVEVMNKFNQVEVLRILHLKNVTLNENKYGVHINLSELSADVIESLKNYIEYVNNQELDLSELEEKKTAFKNVYFSTVSVKNAVTR
jgi:hypothetical protein